MHASLLERGYVVLSVSASFPMSHTAVVAKRLDRSRRGVGLTLLPTSCHPVRCQIERRMTSLKIGNATGVRVMINTTSPHLAFGGIAFDIMNSSTYIYCMMVLSIKDKIYSPESHI